MVSAWPSDGGPNLHCASCRDCRRFIPRSDPLAEVFAQLENPPHRLSKAKSELDGLRKRTSLAKSDGFRVAEFVLAYKTGQGKWREEDSDDCRKPAMSFIDSSSPRICGWARLLYGGALLQTQREDEALQNFETMAQIPGLPQHLQYQAWFRMGYAYYAKKDLNAALRAWLTANEFCSTPNVLENIAWYSDEHGDLANARKYNDQALAALTRGLRANLIPREEEVYCYVNVANSERRYAESGAFRQGNGC